MNYVELIKDDKSENNTNAKESINTDDMDIAEQDFKVKAGTQGLNSSGIGKLDYGKYFASGKHKI